MLFVWLIFQLTESDHFLLHTSHISALQLVESLSEVSLIASWFWPLEDLQVRPYLQSHCWKSWSWVVRPSLSPLLMATPIGPPPFASAYERPIHKDFLGLLFLFSAKESANAWALIVVRGWYWMSYSLSLIIQLTSLLDASGELAHAPIFY